MIKLTFILFCASIVLVSAQETDETNTYETITANDSILNVNISGGKYSVRDSATFEISCDGCMNVFGHITLLSDSFSGCICIHPESSVTFIQAVKQPSLTAE